MLSGSVALGPEAYRKRRPPRSNAPVGNDAVCQRVACIRRARAADAKSSAQIGCEDGRESSVAGLGARRNASPARPGALVRARSEGHASLHIIPDIVVAAPEVRVCCIGQAARSGEEAVRFDASCSNGVRPLLRGPFQEEAMKKEASAGGGDHRVWWLDGPSQRQRQQCREKKLSSISTQGRNSPTTKALT